MYITIYHPNESRFCASSMQRSNLTASTHAQSTIRLAGREERGAAHSHVNNYRRGSNYKAPLQPADTYSSRVHAARDCFLRAVGASETYGGNSD